MEPGSEQTAPGACGPGRIIRRVTAERRVLAYDLNDDSAGEADALADETAFVVHAAPQQLTTSSERFAVVIAHLGHNTQSLESILDAARTALVPDGVAVLIWELSALSAGAIIDAVIALRRAFAVSYVVAARTLWISQAAPLLPELTDLDGRKFVAIASDALWRLQAVTQVETPADELKPIFRLAMEQAIHLENQRSQLAELGNRLGQQSQQLDRQTAELAEVHAGLQAAERANGALQVDLNARHAEIERLLEHVRLSDQRYAAVVDSVTWRVAERARRLTRAIRR